MWKIWFDKLSQDFWFLLAYVITEPQPITAAPLSTGDYTDYNELEDDFEDLEDDFEDLEDDFEDLEDDFDYHSDYDFG